MDPIDIGVAARMISDRLHREMAARRLQRVDIDCIRCAVSAWLTGSGNIATGTQQELLDDLTLRKFVEKCA